VTTIERTIGALTWRSYTATVMTRHTENSINDKDPRDEEPCKIERLTHGSGVAVGWVTTPPTITIWNSGTCGGAQRRHAPSSRSLGLYPLGGQGDTERE